MEHDVAGAKALFGELDRSASADQDWPRSCVDAGPTMTATTPPVDHRRATPRWGNVAKRVSPAKPSTARPAPSDGAVSWENADADVGRPRGGGALDPDGVASPGRGR